MTEQTFTLSGWAIRLAAWWHQQFAGRPDYRMTPETQTVWLAS